MEWYDRLVTVIIVLAGLSAIGYWVGIYLKISTATNKPVFLETNIPEKIDPSLMSNNAFAMAKNDYDMLTLGKEFDLNDFINWLNDDK